MVFSVRNTSEENRTSNQVFVSPSLQRTARRTVAWAPRSTPTPTAANTASSARLYWSPSQRPISRWVPGRRDTAVLSLSVCGLPPGGGAGGQGGGGVYLLMTRLYFHVLVCVE